MNTQRRYDLLLAIYLTARGMGFVLFEGPHTPVDWGLVERRGDSKDAACLQALVELIERYRPDGIVLEDTDHLSSRRRQRIMTLNRHLAAYVEGYGLPLARYSHADVCAAFAHLPQQTKDTIAGEIGRIVPALFRFIPPRRKPWTSEDSRMGLFNAAALMFAHYNRGQIENRFN